PASALDRRRAQDPACFGRGRGMAATFNSPLASILLAIELLPFEWRPRSTVPVEGAVSVATIVRSFILGGDPVFPVIQHVTQIPWNIDLLALVTGVCGAAIAIVTTGGCTRPKMRSRVCHFTGCGGPPSVAW
ncbi:chloride channel protein, partial [Mycobacterium sp.]|uniref:chloride channel protein n=1 Tax=Mycobacterium sp. TaxID=1785 RepID=UPI003BB022BD